MSYQLRFQIGLTGKVERQGARLVSYFDTKVTFETGAMVGTELETLMQNRARYLSAASTLLLYVDKDHATEVDAYGDRIVAIPAADVIEALDIRLKPEYLWVKGLLRSMAAYFPQLVVILEAW